MTATRMGMLVGFVVYVYVYDTVYTLSDCVALVSVNYIQNVREQRAYLDILPACGAQRSRTNAAGSFRVYYTTTRNVYFMVIT